ncbi:hypothetical protein D3C75_1121240 [compost metagenome]
MRIPYLCCNQNNTDCEQCGEDYTNGSILGYAAGVQELDQHGCQQTGDDGAVQHMSAAQLLSDQEGNDDPQQHTMADGIRHHCHSSKDEERSNYSAG